MSNNNSEVRFEIQSGCSKCITNPNAKNMSFFMAMFISIVLLFASIFQLTVNQSNLNEGSLALWTSILTMVMGLWIKVPELKRNQDN